MRRREFPTLFTFSFPLYAATLVLLLLSFTTAGKTTTNHRTGDVRCLNEGDNGCEKNYNADVEDSKLTLPSDKNEVLYDNEENYDYHDIADGDEAVYDSEEEEGDFELYDETSSECVDSNNECPKWARAGECDANPGYMLNHCKKSCTVCMEDANPHQTYPFNVGAPQKISKGDNTAIEMFHLSRKYLLNEILPNPSLAKIHKSCINQEEGCTTWASIGECDANPGYMKLYCALACRSCEMLDVSKRCPLDPNAEEAIRPGDLNRLFERILKNKEYEKYKPKELSRPYHPPEEEKRGDADYVIGPWIVTFDSFLTDEECDRLVTLAAEQGYERSTAVGEEKFDGTTESIIDESRTSENAWCFEECHTDPIAQKVLKRMENVTGVPETNQEYLQMLKYEVGQFYKSHHDFLENDLEFPSGPRILTFYLYLNDVVKGGGTRFTDLDLTVMPKKGKAVLWTNVLDENPMEDEKNTNHEALPVEEGVKYGANAWIHLRDFKTLYDKGC